VRSPLTHARRGPGAWRRTWSGRAGRGRAASAASWCRRGPGIRAVRVWVTGARSQGGRCAAERLVMVGDRYLTDVVFGNRNGLLSVRVAPIELRGEPAAVRLVRAPQLSFAAAGRLSSKDSLLSPTRGDVASSLKGRAASCKAGGSGQPLSLVSVRSDVRALSCVARAGAESGRLLRRAVAAAGPQGAPACAAPCWLSLLRWSEAPRARAVHVQATPHRLAPTAEALASFVLLPPADG